MSARRRRESVPGVVGPAGQGRPVPGRAGARLRRLRLQLGLTTRRVAELSQAVAAGNCNDEFSISHARLVQLENGSSVPSIFKLFTLSAVYGAPLVDLLTLYLDPPGPGKPTDADVAALLVDTAGSPSRKYALIGLSDWTMYPLLAPGSLVQICDCGELSDGRACQSEYDRPIYVVETREGYVCSWCEISGASLISIPHPLSPCRTRTFRYPQEADIVGRVTGIAVRVSNVAERQPAKAGQFRRGAAAVQIAPSIVPEMAGAHLPLPAAG